MRRLDQRRGDQLHLSHTVLPGRRPFRFTSGAPASTGTAGATTLDTVAKKLLVAIALPALLVALAGLGLLWRQTDLAVREDAREDAVGLAEFVATTFSAVDQTPPGTPPRVAHRAVTAAVRSTWSTLRASSLRIIDRDGVVRWSRRIEEEDKPLPDAPRLIGVTAATSVFERSGGGGEVVYPLGGVACAGCHTGDRTLHAGVLQLTVDEPGLRTEVSTVFVRAALSILALVAVLAFGVALGLRVFLTRKLSGLTAAMKRAEDGDFVVRAPDLGSDELGHLARAFNRMLARLTDLKAVEIDTQRDLDRARVELQLKEELEVTAQRLSTRLEELQILYDLARTIASTLDLGEVLSRITQVVPIRLTVPRFSIMLLNDGQLEVLKSHPPGSEGLAFAVGEGICGAAAERRKAVYVPDLEADSLFKVRGGSGAKGRGCLLSVPMVHGAELLGVLNFERPEKADFGPEEIEFFTAVADQAALAVQNARLHEQTVALSITDPLTGVPNRRHLFAQLEAEIHRANRFGTQLSLLMIDIDHFKHLNDTAGHAAGDDALRQVSLLLRTNLRKVDVIARYGGEEFVVLLPQVARHEALEVAEKLRKAIADAPFEHASSQPSGTVTISIGVANLPGDATDQAKLVDCADAALYASKRAGRNKVSPFELGMELHPGRLRGPQANARRPEP